MPKEYNFEKFYGYNSKGNVNFMAKSEYIDGICNFMLKCVEKYNVTLGTCAESIAKKGISKEGCLSVSAVNNMLGTNLEDKGVQNNNQRQLCSCYGGKVDALQYNANCASHCVYCYAKHENDKAMEYYNADGTLKNNDFTRTRESIFSIKGEINKSNVSNLYDTKNTQNLYATALENMRNAEKDRIFGFNRDSEAIVNVDVKEAIHTELNYKS